MLLQKNIAFIFFIIFKNAIKTRKENGSFCAFSEIVSTVWQQSGNILSWSHYRVLIQVEDKTVRDWYVKEDANEPWSVRTLQRNIIFYQSTEEAVFKALGVE